MKYAVYHDESQEAGYWHGILLVPASGRERLLQVLQQIRDNTRYRDPVSLKNLSRTGGRQYRCIRAWIQFASVSLMQKLKGQRVAYDIGIDRPTPQHGSLESPLAAKFILFRVRNGHRAMTGLRDHAAKIETTFRMALKGGLHLFAGSDAISMQRGFSAGSGRYEITWRSRRRYSYTTGPVITESPKASPTSTVNYSSSPICSSAGFGPSLDTRPVRRMQKSPSHFGHWLSAGIRARRECGRAGGIAAFV